MGVFLAIVYAFGGALVGAVTTEVLVRRRAGSERARKAAREISDELARTREAMGLLRVTLAGLEQRHNDLFRFIAEGDRRKGTDQ